MSAPEQAGPSWERPGWVPGEVDIEQPSIARIWDWFLGGTHNFAADREVAKQMLEVMPEGPVMAQLMRGFLRRAVHHCLLHGVDQFLDVGSGIPTVGNVHEVAQGYEPNARVVYVDVDPVAVAHTRRMLAGNAAAGVVQADLRRPEEVLSSDAVSDLLDLSRPVALLMVSVLHFVTDEEDPAGIIGRYHDALAPGSILVVGHGSRHTEDMDTEHLHAANHVYQRSVTTVSLRSRSEVAALFGGFELVPPGIVWVPEWHPDVPPDASLPKAGYAGVGRKP